MEVRNQAVDGFQLDAGIDEDAGIPAARHDLAVLSPDRFQRAAARCAHGNDAVARGAGLVDELRRFLADGVPLAVHLVVLNGFLIHGTEGAQADMQRDLGNVDTAGADRIHQLRGKVQARGGRGSAAQFLGVDGLVLALILELLRDVGRQRHLAELVQLLVQCLGVVGKGHILIAVRQRLIHHGGQAAVAELHLRARLHPLAGAGQALPGIALDLAEQQQLADSACGHLGAHQAGIKHYTEIMEFLVDLNKKGVTILMVTHDMHLMLEYTNKVIVLSEGEKIADNIPAYILTNKEIIEKANLKETSLHQLALKCDIEDTTKFVNKFIDYDRRVR